MCDPDRWPIPPYHPEDYWALEALLGPEEFERVVLGSGVHSTANAAELSGANGATATSEDLLGTCEALPRSSVTS